MVGFIGGSTNFPLWYDIPIQPYGNVLVAIYSFLVGYGLYRNRISGISVDASKAGVCLLLNLSVALFYLLFAGLYRTATGDPLEAYELWFQGVAAFCVSAIVFWGVPRLKFWTEKILEGVFRSDRASALSELKDLPTKFSDIAEDESVLQLAADTVMRSLDVAGVAVYAFQLAGFRARSLMIRRCTTATPNLRAAVGRFRHGVMMGLIQRCSKGEERRLT